MEEFVLLEDLMALNVSFVKNAFQIRKKPVKNKKP